MLGPLSISKWACVRRIVYNQLVAFALLFLAACGGGGGGGGGATTPVAPPIQYTYTPPVDSGDGWVVASLADEGMDEGLITTMMERIIDGTYPGIDAVAIARNNKLVLHQQFRWEMGPFDPRAGNTDPERHILHSTRLKDVTAAEARFLVTPCK